MLHRLRAFLNSKDIKIALLHSAEPTKYEVAKEFSFFWLHITFLNHVFNWSPTIEIILQYASCGYKILVKFLGELIQARPQSDLLLLLTCPKVRTLTFTTEGIDHKFSLI